MRSNSPAIKLVLLGDGRVGKTSLVLRYVNNVFSEKQMATIQASYLTKRLTVDGQTVTLSIWDTAGQERFHALGPIYYRDADDLDAYLLQIMESLSKLRVTKLTSCSAALLVYDLLDKDSFDRVQSWVKELRNMASKNIVLSIAGNKSDMDKLRQVNLQDTERYAESIGATHFVTSAKLNSGIEEAFLDIAHRVLQKRELEGADELTAGSRRKTVVIMDKQIAAPPPPSKCCS